MMKNLFFFTGAVWIGMIFSSPVQAQTVDYKARIREINQNIDLRLKDKNKGLYFETADSIQKENPHSWLWPVCALIQAANEEEALKPGSRAMAPVVKAIDQYYNGKSPAAYQDYVTAERLSSKFYDDNQWVAIAYLDAYKRTRLPRYLKASKMIYQFMMKGLDTVSGGGLYWKEGDFGTKNTCSNGPGILVALQLYKTTKDKQYLKSAMAIYHWTNKKLQSPEGLFYDAIKVPSGKIDKTFYTYNAGTMLQSNAMLYSVTKEKKYLLEAQRIAKAAKAYFYKKNRLPGHYWFNAVMLRGFIELYRIDKNEDWVNFYIAEGNRIWDEERDEHNLLGKDKHKTLIDQAAMIEIYARLAQLNKK